MVRLRPGRMVLVLVLVTSIACGGRSHTVDTDDGENGGRAGETSGQGGVSGASGSTARGGQSGTVATGGSSFGGVAGSVAGTGGAAGSGGAAGAGGVSIPPLACDAGDPVPIPPEVTAERLSRLFFEEPASDDLLETARNDGLRTTGAVGCFARTLLRDERAGVGIADFFGGWLDLAKHPAPLQDPAYVPEFSPELLASAKAASVWYATTLARSGGTFSRLLQDREMPMNSELAPFYGVSIDAADAFVLLDLHGERAGILTQLYFPMSRTTTGHGSPTQRGAAFTRMLGCQEIASPPPPIDLTDDVPAVFEGTTRSWYAASIGSETCLGCHAYLTLTGYAFEHFDVLGRYRDVEAGEPIDASAYLAALDTTGVGLDVNGHVEAMRVTSSSPIARDCMGRHWLSYAVGSLRGERLYVPEMPLDGDDIDHVFRRASYDPEFSLSEMLVAGVETSQFLAP